MSYVTYNVTVGYNTFKTRMRLRDARRKMAAFIRHERSFSTNPRKIDGSRIREYRGYGSRVAIDA